MKSTELAESAGSDMATEGIKIGELVRQAGVTRATVHHYVREGLLPQPIKTSRNMALYDPSCVERVTSKKIHSEP